MEKLIGILCFAPYYILMVVLLFILSSKLTTTELFIGISFLIMVTISSIFFIKGMTILKKEQR